MTLDGATFNFPVAYSFRHGYCMYFALAVNASQMRDVLHVGMTAFRGFLFDVCINPVFRPSSCTQNK
jgi:hypothetical protein